MRPSYMHGTTSFSKKSVGSIAVAALLIFGVYTIMPLTSGAYAQGAVTITTSADSHNGRFFGPALLEVMFQSSQHAADNSIGTAQVTVEAFGTSRQLSLNETTGTSGIFLMYVKVDKLGDPADTLATAEGPHAPATPFHATNFVSLYIGSGGAGDNTAYTTPGTERSLSTTNVAEGGTIRFTFGGVEKVITWDDTPAKVTLDRSNYGPESMLYVRVYDPDMNLDPTDSNRFNDGGLGNLTYGFDHPENINATYVETGPNTATFEAAFDVRDLDAGQTSDSRSITANDYKNFTSAVGSEVALFNALLAGTSSASYVVQIANGQFSNVPSTLTYSGELPLTVTDPDMNKNSKSQEALTGKLFVVPDGQGEFKFNLRENSLSSSQFVPGYGQDRIKVTFKEPTDPASGTLFLRPGDEVELFYEDDKNTLGTTPQNTSSVIREISNTSPQLEVDRTGVSKTSEVTLTLIDPELNDDSTLIESYTVPFNATTNTDATVSFNVPSIGTVDVFNMVIELNSELIDLNGPFSVTFIETGQDTGVFEATIDLADLDAAFAGTFEDGDRITVEITDVLEKPNGPSAEVSMTVGVEDAVVEVGKNTLPVPRSPAADKGPTGAAEPGIANLGPTLLDITIIDDSRNTNRFTQETIATTAENVSVHTGTGARVFTFGTNDDIILTLTPAPGATFTDGEDITISIDTAFRETGPDTGIFTGTIAIDADGVDKPAWIGAKLTIQYGDASTRTVTFTTRQAILSTDTPIVVNGGTLTITVTDADANRDVGEEEEVKVRVMWVSDTGVNRDQWLTLEETGKDTGVFQETLDVGTDSIGNSPFRVSPNEEVDIYYYDLTPRVSSTKATWDDANNSGLRLERTLTTGAASGSLSVGISGTSVGPSAKVEVTVVDMDVNTRPTQKDDLLDRVTVATDRGVNVVLDLEETEANSGVFVGEINLIPSDDLNQQAENGDEVFVPVLPGDVVSVRYQDESDENGRRTTISRTFNIISVDPEITLDNTVYSAGETMIITLSDIDANEDSDSNDIINVRVTSTSDAVGLSNVQLIETGPDTGVFVGTVSLTSQFTSGSLQVSNGDIITIRYTDKYPADYKDRLEAGGQLSKDFNLTVPVGSAISSGSTTPSAPVVRDSQNNPVTQVLAGQQVVLSSTIKNNEAAPTPYTAIVEVRDSDGVTEYLSWQSGTLQANGSTNIGLSWIPDEPGTHTIRIFVVSDLANPVILSSIVTSTVTVS